MKTYSQLKGRKKFNWYKALNAQNIDWEDLQDKGRSWVTCACGNTCSIIPRDKDGMPLDQKLQDLGGDQGFFGALRCCDVKKSLSYLDMIEKRVVQLIPILIKQKQKEILELQKL